MSLWKLQMTTVWVKNNHWEIKTEKPKAEVFTKLLHSHPPRVSVFLFLRTPSFTPSVPKWVSYRPLIPLMLGNTRSWGHVNLEIHTYFSPEKTQCLSTYQRPWAPSRKETCLFVLHPLFENLTTDPLSQGTSTRI